MTRITIKLSAIILCMSLSGCFAFAVPIFDTNMEGGLQEGLDKRSASIGAMAKNNALAVAKEPGRWSNRGAYGQPSEAEARTQALAACNESAKASGFTAPCKIYSVNGVVEN